MSEQALVSGERIAEEYGKWGISHLTHVAPPTSLFGVIVGPYGSGKTSLFSSLKGCLIINCDLHSSPKARADSPPCEAQFFPALDKKGIPIGPDGAPLRLTWEIIENLKDKIVAAVKAGNPHPRTIVLDSLLPSISLKQPWVANQMGHGSWDNIPEGKPGLKAWGKIYDSYIPWIMDLRYSGIGVYITTQFVHKQVAFGNEVREDIGVAMPDKLWERLQPYVEFLAAVEYTSELTRDDKGKPTGTRKRRYLVNHSAKLSELVRSRVALPDKIELPDTDAWAVFEKAYLDVS